jgi:hypothetical protein
MPPMLMGDLIAAVQEKLPIKVAVHSNGSLDFAGIGTLPL